MNPVMSIERSAPFRKLIYIKGSIGNVSTVAKGEVVVCGLETVELVKYDAAVFNINDVK